MIQRAIVHKSHTNRNRFAVHQWVVRFHSRDHLLLYSMSTHQVKRVWPQQKSHTIYLTDRFLITSLSRSAVKSMRMMTVDNGRSFGCFNRPAESLLVLKSPCCLASHNFHTFLWAPFKTKQLQFDLREIKFLISSTERPFLIDFSIWTVEAFDFHIRENATGVCVAVGKVENGWQFRADHANNGRVILLRLCCQLNGAAFPIRAKVLLLSDLIRRCCCHQLNLIHI